MPQPSLDDLAARCERTVHVDTFGLITRVHTTPADETDLRFHFPTPDKPPARPHAEAWLYADGGFFRSVFAKDGAPKTMAFRDLPTGTATIRRFHRWSGTPAFVPPLAGTAFTTAYFLVPGDVVQAPDASETVLITGRHHVGKTALTLALFERGWTHVSDQLAVLRQDDLTVAPQHGVIGLRRRTLARYRPALHALDTRTITSEATGDVVLARVTDLFPHMPAHAGGRRITRHLHLTAHPEETPEPAAAAAHFAARHCYPAHARPRATQALNVPTQTIPVPTTRHITDLAEEITEQWTP